MKHILTILFAMMALSSYASEPISSDTLSSEKVDTAQQVKKSWMTRFLDYFNDANKNKQHKRFDFSVIGGPHYASDTKFGLGMVAAGLYRTDPNDSILPPSNVSLFGDVSSVGFYMLGVRGNHIAPAGRYRIDYHLYFYSFPSDFWGIGYEMGDNDDNKSDMKRWQAQAEASFLFRVADNFYVGPMAAYDYVIGKQIERPELLQGMDKHTWNVGVGVSLVYDNRDNLTNPHRGIYLNLKQMFRPKFMGNDYAFSTTHFRFDAYQRLSKGTILAEDFGANLNFGNPSWGMMAELGGTSSMRGYYEGRYRDKHSLEATVELRQHVWKRNGIVVWSGAGTVFPKFSALRSRQILPNAGVGYRWEFKKNVNVRLDYGFGKSGQSGFLFNINEAF
ncbi:BamA/TamA family outer membrane protein [Prevotella copri]|uniref:BamA/TamA family outer membrane protein n=2 Tax=Segatella copri TaxID=165179 RepID=A0A6G1VJK8_9BACT|nr:BamA/TamA family outer membrane protein [Segatella copri]MQN60685.1 BamA/TamA family outer membrane protein [Segatella copri]MQP13580.1 BamA/TamA family outer membrane protein [Segatella copri]